MVHQQAGPDADADISRDRKKSRNAISIGGDSDTVGCIAGSIAEALYGIPAAMHDKGLAYLPADLRRTVDDFEEKFGRCCSKGLDG